MALIETFVRPAAHTQTPVIDAPATQAASGRRQRRIGIIAIIVSASAMGLAGVFGRLATPSGAVIGAALTMGRMAVGAIGMFVILAAGRRIGSLRRVRLSWSVALGGVFLGLSLATYLSSTVLTDLARAVALHYLGPVVATVLARVLLKERASGAELGSLAVSFIGMMLAAGIFDADSVLGTQTQLQGDVLAAVSGVLYGAALLCYRYRGDMPSDVRSFWNFAFGTLATGAMVVITRPDLSGMTASNWAWAGLFFVVCGLLALGLLVVAGKYLRSIELSALSYWEVVVAMLMGAAIYGEAFTPLSATGAALIVAAAIGTLRQPRPVDAS